MSDSFTNYNYVGNTKVSVSIKKTYANKCTLKSPEHGLGINMGKNLNYP